MKDVEWFHGSLSETNVMEMIALPRGPSIVLAAPRSACRSADLKIGVGHSEVTRTIWRQFLTVSGLLRRTGRLRDSRSFFPFPFSQCSTMGLDGVGED
jgi:hypothetical protein